MSEMLQQEVDTNFEAFQRILSELFRRNANRWAL